MSERIFPMLLKEGIAAARGGNKTLAYQLLQKATNISPDNELGWLWLAGVSESPQEAVEHLKRVLEINPDNEHARSGLRWAQELLVEIQEKGDPEKISDWNCPLCLTSFPERLTVCRSCGSVLVLTELETLMNNNGVKRSVLLEAIGRLQEDGKDESPFDKHFTLALAYLNLGQFEEGIHQLHQALRARPEDEFLKTRIAELVCIGSKELEEVSQRLSVLVVDDSPTIRRLVEITLEREGYRVITAVDGQEGLATIMDELPDLILLDITMPRMNGYQLCKAIKTNQDTSKIPVIMLSGKDEVADKEMGRKVGSSGYITKPFEPDELIKYVSEYTNQNNG